MSRKKKNRENQIATLQSEEDIIDMHKAKRHLYKKAKNRFYGNFWICILFCSLSQLIKVIIGTRDCAVIAAVVSVVCSGLSFALLYYSNKLQNLAARIQLKLDCTLFNFPWVSEYGKEPDPEEIERYSNNQENDDYESWYHNGISSLPFDVSILICQRSNILYEKGLRDAFSKLLYYSAAFIFVVIIMATLYKAENFGDIILRFVTMVPIIVWLVNSIRLNITSKSKIENLANNCNALWKQALSKKLVTWISLRDQQRQIFKSKESKLLIPESIYKRTHERLEREGRYAVEFLINEYIRKK